MRDTLLLIVAVEMPRRLANTPPPGYQGTVRQHIIKILSNRENGSSDPESG